LIPSRVVFLEAKHLFYANAEGRILADSARPVIEDTINDTDEPIFYDPQLFGVQLRTEIYTASVVDASGTMPPHSTTVAFFAITGTPNGGRNDLAPVNSWNVLRVAVCVCGIFR
jgi:hypothetical protein